MVTAEEVTAAKSRQRKQYRRAASFSSQALRLEEDARTAEAAAGKYAGGNETGALILKEWEAQVLRETAQRYRELAEWHLGLARTEGENVRQYEVLASRAA